MKDIQSIQADLTDAARSVFADMAFLDVAEPNDEEVKPDIHGPWASIQVNGSIRGLIVILMPLELKKALIEAIYAQPWEDLPVNQKDDGLLEVLNVLAGYYVSSQERQNGFLKLSIPSIVFDSEDLPARKPEVNFYLDAQGALFQLMFFSTEAKE
ncbi:MAG: hypothetical protein RQ801_10690 [Spirochaetaceae bacterium]|nr:hypothetical protein [Spirochaetaceae bacterium]MDT8298758.1 hypothetical protein [Spirochaetaceae bacterium]